MATLIRGNSKVKQITRGTSTFDADSFIEMHTSEGDAVNISYTDFIDVLSGIYLVAGDTRLYYGTSVNSLSIGGGVQTFDTQSGLAYTVGQRVRLSYNSANYMEGYITAYSTTVMTINVDYKGGSGTYNVWVLSPTTEQVVPDGGTTGQVLGKASATPYDVEWVNVSSGSLSGSDAILDCGDRMSGNEVMDMGLRV